MIGMAGSRARTRRATRCVKSGLSMMTRISADPSVTAAAVCRINRSSFGSWRTTAASPTIDTSSIGNSDASPSRVIARPPTPWNWTASPRRWRNTFIRPAPSRSPDSSVAIRKILRAILMVGTRAIRSTALWQAGHKDAGAIGGLDHRLRLGEKRVAGRYGNSRKPGAGHTLDRSRTDGRQIEAQVLVRLGRLDQNSPSGGGPDATPFPQGGNPCKKPVGAVNVLDPDHMSVDHDHGLSDV